MEQYTDDERIKEMTQFEIDLLVVSHSLQLVVDAQQRGEEVSFLFEDREVKEAYFAPTDPNQSSLQGSGGGITPDIPG
jgi:hypothetical protein